MGGPMDSRPDRSFGGVSFVSRTGDKKGKSGVVSLRTLSADEQCDFLSTKIKKFLLKVDRNNLGICSKDGKSFLKTFPIDMCTFRLDDRGHIDAICPGLKFQIQAKETNSWLLALQANSSGTGLTGSHNVKRKDSLGLVLNEPPKPHLSNRTSLEIQIEKPRGSSMGMKVCGGGGPDGDPERPEIFVFSLDEGGIAAKAGLIRGDVVLTVDKTPLTGMNVTEAAKELSRAGGVVQLKVLRKAKKHSEYGHINATEAVQPKKPSQKEKKASTKSQNKAAKAAEKESKKQKKASSKKKGGQASDPSVARSASEEDGFGFGSDDAETPASPKSPESTFGFGSGSEPDSPPMSPKEKIKEKKRVTVQEKKQEESGSTDANADDEKARRAARLAKLRASRKTKQEGWKTELMAALKIIDDLQE